jgi:hypothetical protein
MSHERCEGIGAETEILGSSDDGIHEAARAR